MREQVTADVPFERSELSRDEALAQLDKDGQPFKVEIVRELPDDDAQVISFYRHDGFVDLCRGPHVPSTGRLGPFKLLNSAAAYWRGDETRPMLQRIYGTVWETQDDLDHYLWRMEEAKKRDHRKLGRELDLFTFHPESPAAPFWHPRGMALWRALEEWSLEVRRGGGFDEVRTPSLVRSELWQQSGHWDLYQDNMFVLDADEHVAGLKPMNCPESMLIYKTRSRSVPRPADALRRLLDWLFRKERTGALAGMFRVRQLTQDDSHVFCREDQVADELRLALSLVQRQYAPFGFTPPSGSPRDRRSGSGQTSSGTWRRAGCARRWTRSRIAYRLDPGGAAFYAPKIDVFIEDALGREWQLPTIQLDYQLPQRFDLEYRSGPRAASSGR